MRRWGGSHLAWVIRATWVCVCGCHAGSSTMSPWVDKWFWLSAPAPNPLYSFVAECPTETSSPNGPVKEPVLKYKWEPSCSIELSQGLWGFVPRYEQRTSWPSTSTPSLTHGTGCHGYHGHKPSFQFFKCDSHARLSNPTWSALVYIYDLSSYTYDQHWIYSAGYVYMYVCAYIYMCVLHIYIHVQQ